MVHVLGHSTNGSGGQTGDLVDEIQCSKWGNSQSFSRSQDWLVGARCVAGVYEITCG